MLSIDLICMVCHYRCIVDESRCCSDQYSYMCPNGPFLDPVELPKRVNEKMTNSDEKLSLKRETDWLCVIFNLQVVMSFICGVRFIIYDAYLTTTLFAIILILLGLIGTMAGSHRLWAHHSYKATASLKVFLMICQTLTAQGTIYEWVRRHRLHHKHFGTNLDPYNPSNGFIYSHFLSNNLKFSPAQEAALDEIDMSDLTEDKIVMFQKKFYWILFVIVTVLLPINAPAEYWNETILNSLFIAGLFRYSVVLHLSWLIHSATAIWSLDVDQRTAYESNLVFLINKSYWLSYHYMAPWDYQVSEYGKYSTDCTSKFIRVCAALEMASDLKLATSDMVKEALYTSIDTKEPISDCLAKAQNLYSEKLSRDHYLTPSKFA